MTESNPFSILDFLGYFFPGATALIVLYHYVPDVHRMIPIDAQTSALVYIICIIAAYILGHIIALVSSITIEKYAVWKYRYPSEYLLKSYSRGLYFGDKPVNSSDIDKEKRDKLMSSKIVLKVLVPILVLPVFIIDFVLSRAFWIDYYYTRRFSEQQISMIRAKCRNLFKMLGLDETRKSIFSGDFHRVIHNYYYEKENTHSRRMDNCIAIYDFLRAMSIVFCAVFFFELVNGLKSLDLNAAIDWTRLLYIALSSILAYICFMGFMKFYRKFTVENFMCLLCDKGLNVEIDTKQNNYQRNSAISNASQHTDDNVLTTN